MLLRGKDFKLASRIAVLGLLLSQLILGAAPAFAGSNRTWSGNGGNSLMSNAANWQGGVAPLNGDNVIFPSSAPASQRQVTNDIAGLSLANIIFNGVYVGGDTTGFTVTGSPLTVSNGVDDQTTVTTTMNLDLTLGNNASFNASYSGAAGQSGTLVLGGSSGTAHAINLNNHNVIFKANASVNKLFVYSNISGNGNVTLNGNGAVTLAGTSSTFTGSINETSGSLSLAAASSAGDAANTVLTTGTAELILGGCSDTGTITFPYSFDITGAASVTSGINEHPKLAFGASCTSGGVTYDELYGANPGNGASYQITGDISLGSDITVGGAGSLASLNGAIGGLYALTVIPHSGLSLTLASASNSSNTTNGTYTAAPITQTLTDSQPTNKVGVDANSSITLDGTRGDTYVYGTLNGNGTINGLLSVLSSGTVAPGHSPGCITSTSLSLTGAYQAQIGGLTACSQYDQLIVTTGPVTLTSASLQLSFVNGFVPVGGQKFTIINQAGTTPVSGTFRNLAEGATLKVNGVEMQISYVGGDGNDVVLSAVVKAPATGVGRTSSPLSPIALGLIFTIALSLIVAIRIRRITSVN